VFNARMNQAVDHRCNWNDGDMPYSELETVLHREASSAVSIYCFGPQKTEFPFLKKGFEPRVLNMQKN
jgi:hypothetical protein